MNLIEMNPNTPLYNFVSKVKNLFKQIDFSWSKVVQFFTTIAALITIFNQSYNHTFLGNLDSSTSYIVIVGIGLVIFALILFGLSDYSPSKDVISKLIENRKTISGRYPFIKIDSKRRFKKTINNITYCVNRLIRLVIRYLLFIWGFQFCIYLLSEFNPSLINKNFEVLFNNIFKYAEFLIYWKGLIILKLPITKSNIRNFTLPNYYSVVSYIIIILLIFEYSFIFQPSTSSELISTILHNSYNFTGRALSLIMLCFLIHKLISQYFAINPFFISCLFGYAFIQVIALIYNGHLDNTPITTWTLSVTFFDLIGKVIFIMLFLLRIKSNGIFFYYLSFENDYNRKNKNDYKELNSIIEKNDI